MHRLASLTSTGLGTVAYGYDDYGKLTTITRGSTTYSLTYDAWNRPISTKVGTTALSTNTYDSDNRPTATTLSNGKTVTNTYDALGRLTRKRIGLSSNYDTTFTYLAGANNSQTALLASYQNGSDTAYTYTYDENGNITSISQGGSTTYYTYDRLNELIREDNATLNQSWTYTYDVNGNLLNKKRYAYVPNGGTLGACLETISYGYDAAHQDWADQLTSYNGETIRYDDSGNPISYRGYTMAWQGKRLTSAAKTGTAITYSYDENGIRTQKTVNGVTTNYYYNGSVLISQVTGNDTLLFSYDASGNVVSVNFNGTDYYYVRNGQGDVVKLIDGNGTTVTEYTYDTWGKLVSCTGSLSATLGTLNPFRYRGYVYDNETGFYYLQSRYYDPEVGKFISADVFLSTGQGTVGYNTYAYCLNNPVNRSDPSGCVSKKDRLLTESDKLYGDPQEQSETASLPILSGGVIAGSASHDANRRPNTGRPGSTFEAPNGDKRTYGSDGKPIHDYDHDDHGNPEKHPHDENGGHNHDWVDGDRGDPYCIDWEPVIGVVILVVCAIAILVVAGDDASGIGVVDDFLIGPICAGLGKGFAMVFG